MTALIFLVPKLVYVLHCRHTSRFMIMWLTLLPFTTYSSLGWGTIPVCCVIAFLLLGRPEGGWRYDRTPSGTCACASVVQACVNN